MRAKAWLRREALRALTWLFVALVVAFTVRHALTIDWPAVGRSLAATPGPVLWQAAGLAATSHAVFSCFDLFGRQHTHHGLPVPRVMAVNFVSYAFNLNLGAVVGGVAMRFRLYAQQGLSPGVITQVLALSWLTNWLGYCALGGALFLLAPPPLPAHWALGTLGLRLLGALLLAAAAAYLGLCLRARQRQFTVRGYRLVLPRARMAAVQLVVSAVHWLLLGQIVTVLLQDQVPLTTALGVLMVGAIATLVTHVPAGLGVLEAVFVALLSDRVPVPQLLAALLAYRAVYYLAPWALAGGLLLHLERLRSASFSARPRPPSRTP